MASKIEILGREEAGNLVGIFSRLQRILIITGVRCDEIHLWIMECGSGFDSIVVRTKDGNKIICLIIPEFCVSQADCDIFNKTFMLFKLAWSNDLDDWHHIDDLKAVPTSHY